MTEQLLRLGTGDLWDDRAGRAVDNGCHPDLEPDDYRQSVEYIGKFRERIPLGRAIRMMCGACMGGEQGRLPLGKVAQDVDDCGSCTCPLWPFRFGRDPWRPEMSEEERDKRRAIARERFGRPESFRPASAESVTDQVRGSAGP
jgi:hypothetical protein